MSEGHDLFDASPQQLRSRAFHLMLMANRPDFADKQSMREATWQATMASALFALAASGGSEEAVPVADAPLVEIRCLIDNAIHSRQLQRKLVLVDAAIKLTTYLTSLGEYPDV